MAEHRSICWLKSASTLAPAHNAMSLSYGLLAFLQAAVGHPRTQTGRTYVLGPHGMPLPAVRPPVYHRPRQTGAWAVATDHRRKCPLTRDRPRLRLGRFSTNGAWALHATVDHNRSSVMARRHEGLLKAKIVRSLLLPTACVSRPALVVGCCTLCSAGHGHARGLSASSACARSRSSPERRASIYHPRSVATWSRTPPLVVTPVCERTVTGPSTTHRPRVARRKPFPPGRYPESKLRVPAKLDRGYYWRPWNFHKHVHRTPRP